MTRTAQWLAAGFRHDDVALWRELCVWLDQHGATPAHALPAHLAPLVLREPENAYVHWLHEQHLMPVVHLTGMTARGGNGWRAKRDWQDRLAVLADPTPDRLLAWWRSLAVTWSERVVRVTEEMRYVFVPATSTAETLRFQALPVPYHLCLLCKGRSWSDDRRGVLHHQRGSLAWDRVRPDPEVERAPYGDCPLLQLRRATRAAEAAVLAEPTEDSLGGKETVGRSRGATQALQHALDLQRIGATYQEAGARDIAAFRQALHTRGTPIHILFRGYEAVADHDVSQLATREDTGYWHHVEMLGKRGPAAIHIAQLCMLWIAPTAASMGEYAAFLRREADSSHGLGNSELERQVAAVYLEAASELEALLT
jgi:hypothetical protein